MDIAVLALIYYECMQCMFLIAIKPKSSNGGRDPEFSRKIAEAAALYYSGPYLEGPLYSRIVWFHKYHVRPDGKGETLDADNIAKRVHDSLKQVLFEDDHSISHSLAVRVDATDGVDIVPDRTQPAGAVYLSAMLGDPTVRDVLYVELGSQQNLSIQLGAVI